MPRKNRIALASMAFLALFALCVALCTQQSFPLAGNVDAEHAPIGNVDAGGEQAPNGNGAEEAASGPSGSADEDAASRPSGNGDEGVESRPTEADDKNAKSASDGNGNEKSRQSKSDKAPSDATSSGTSTNDTASVQQTPDEHTTVEDAAYEQLRDAAETSADANQADNPPFELPEGVEVEPRTTVMEIGKGADLDLLALELEQSLGAVTIERVTDTYARVAYSGDVAVEDAVNRIVETGLAESAQPNYMYHVLSDELTSASETDEIGPILVQSDAPDDMYPSSDVQGDVESIKREGRDAESVSVAADAQPEHGDMDDGSTGASNTAPDSTSTQGGQDESAPGIALDEGSSAQAYDSQNPLDDIELVDEEQGVVVDPGDDELPDDGDESQDSLILDQATGLDSEDPENGTNASEPALQTQSSTNDPYAKKQWALDSLNAYDAWNYVRSYNKVTVATLDLGFQVNHADLRANIVDPYNAYNAVHGWSTSDVSPYETSFDHGSHVAGIIGAVANNGIGIAGITRNTANVMPIKVVDNRGIATTLSIVKAYDYLLGKRTSRNVRVVNLSMGADTRQLTYTNMSLDADDAILKKVRQAYAAGIVTVCASGNKGSSIDSTLPFACYPSEDNNVVSVMNLMQSGSGVVRSSTSNYNATNARSKDISAPGTGIYSTVAFGAYSSMSGTSMAAPYVSGVLALEFAVNPKLTPKDAIKILYATATNMGGSSWTRYYGWGEANAAAAVRAAAHGMTAAQTAKARLVAPYLPGAASSSSGTSGSTTSTQKKTPTVSYRTHVQRTGWQGWRKNGKMAGTTGQSLRLEAIRIKLLNKPYSGTIQYRTHVQTYGWEKTWTSAAKTSGTSGQSKRLEAIRIRLTGNMAKHYDVYYRVHAQSLGWMGWAKNGAMAGTAGYSYRLEAIQVRLVPKGGAAPGSTVITYVSKT